MSEDEKLLKEAKKLPWDERLAHKNWKVRNDANIDLTAVCDGIADPKDPKLREFGPLFRKALVDSNAPVQEKALDAVMAFLRASDTDAARYAKEICDSIIAKCLTGRPKTIEKAQAVFLLWVELEAAETFLDAMEKAIKNKVAKAVVPAIDVMFQAVSEFGTKIVPPKRILKMLPELFDHQDQSVRASAKGLTIELCRWIGKDVIKSILFEKMRDTMKKELEAELVNVTGVPKPTRKIRSEQTKEFEEEAVEVSGNKHDEEATSECVPETDEYDLVDPIDILTPLEKSGFWDGVKATKWSERRDGVAELTKLASARRIAPGDFTEVSRTLKKLITDVNIAVAVEAVQGAGNLANGLRKDFSSGSRILLPVLLEKLKEKKQVMVEALTQTLQAMHKGGCLSLVDVIEEVKAATKNKVPTVRSLTLNWVTFCIETSPKAVVLKLHKDYVPILMESLNDGTPDVRDAAFSALAAIAKLVGMRPLERSLEKLDDVRRKKLTDMIGTEGSNNSSNPPAASGRAVGGAGVMTAEASQGAGQKRSAASMLSGKKPVAPDTQKAKSNAPGKQSTTKKGEASGKTPKNETPEDIEPGEMSLEDIEAKVSSFLDASVLGNLKSSVWKERLEAMVTLKEMVESLPDIEQCTELIVRLLSTLPGWNEKNVQVQQKVVEVITNLTERSTKFSKRCVVLCIVGVAERMADIKTRAQAMKCLTGFCEAVGPSFVFERLFKVMKEHKNPKVFSECLLWMVAAVDDFGISHLKLKDIIDFCKDVGLQSSVPATRNATIKLLGILHKFVGPDIKGFLTDVKPALQSALDAEYEKNPYEGPVSAPKRTIRAAECADGGGGSGADGLPREDISSKLTPALLKNLASPDWKVRQESIEVINKIIEESNKRIQPTGTGEMFLALKARLSDSNRNLVVITLATLGNLAQAMGPAVEKSSKGILADILKCLGDNKKQTREAAVKTLDSWVAVFELDKMVPYIVPALLDPKICPDGRKDLYDWMTKQINKLNEQPELTQFIKPAAASLQDKSADVRKAAEACLVDLIRACGSEQATRAIRDLQGPSLAAALPILERQRPLGQEFSDSMNLSLNKPIVTKAGAGRNTKVASNGTSDRPPSRSGPSSRSAVSKIAQGKGSKQAAAATVRDAALQGLALFNLKDSNKDERERFISRKFKFEEARPEQVQEIEADLLKYFREDVHRRLLSPDFKKQVEGIEILQKALPMHVKEIIEVIDVLLRWSALRFCESNTTLLLKVLEFFPELVEALKNEGYTLSEFEANIFLPCLVEKSGHNIEKVREKIRELTKLMCFIYPASKAFIFIVEGLRSKNNRTKIECADQIGFMIDRYGIEIAAGPIKALQAVAALTSERDGELRKSALQTLAVAYKILGDDIWRYVGKLSDAQKSMLDDKFKWKAREMDKRKEGRPGEARSALRRSIRDNGPEVAEQSGELGYRPVTVPNAFPSGVHGQYEEQPFHGGSHLSNGPSDWSEALHIIDYSTTPEQDVEAMKLICHELSQSAADTDNTGLDAVLKDSNRLVCGLTKRVSSTFKLGLAGASSRSCKYVLNTLMQTFQLKKLAHAVKDDTSNKLITELLLWLLDERVPLMDDGSQLLKALNVLMLKILENAERTSAFVVLIQLLRPLDPSRWPSPTSEEMVLIRGQKFSDLVVKCLIKLTKVLGSTIYEVDLDRLLHSIHEYLQELGLEEIRRRAGADDKPLRMVKTVLHELVKLRGTAVKGHLSMVPLDSEPPPIILAYIDLNLQTLAAARMLTPATATSHSHWTESTSNGGATAGGGGGGGSSVAPHSSETQLKQELAAIFKKIGDKQTCTIGLYELYRITQLYPQVDIFSQLQNASEAFRTYIRDGLAQMAKNAASGRTPGSASVATPPPVSLPTHDLPKIAPLSPNRGDTNGLPSANRYAENPDSIDISNGGVRMGRTRSPSRQYDVPHVPSGTLDSIRERMKSIQAAGGTMNPHSNGSSVPNLMARNVVLQSIDSSNMEALSQMAHNNPPLEDKALSGLQARMERLKSGALENLS